MKPAIPQAHAAARSLTRIGVNAAREGQEAAAIGAYREALEVDPTHMPAHVNLASILLHSGQMTEAIEACERAMELTASADHPYLWLVCGMARAELGDRWAAEEDLLHYQQHARDPRFTRIVWRTMRELERSATYRRAA
jgi:Tfp pilus assembly protein PilF